MWGWGGEARGEGIVRSARSETTKDMTCTAESFKNTPSVIVTALLTGKHEVKKKKKLSAQGVCIWWVGRFLYMKIRRKKPQYNVALR